MESTPEILHWNILNIIEESCSEAFLQLLLWENITYQAMEGNVKGNRSRSPIPEENDMTSPMPSAPVGPYDAAQAITAGNLEKNEPAVIHGDMQEFAHKTYTREPSQMSTDDTFERFSKIALRRDSSPVSVKTEDSEESDFEWLPFPDPFRKNKKKSSHIQASAKHQNDEPSGSLINEAQSLLLLDAFADVQTDPDGEKLSQQKALTHAVHNVGRGFVHEEENQYCALLQDDVPSGGLVNEAQSLLLLDSLGDDSTGPHGEQDQDWAMEQDDVPSGHTIS